MQCNLGRTLVLAALCFYALGAAADATTDRARALLQRNESGAAYKLLLPLESQRAGDPEYDYLLGVSALDAGDPERAVFALERVLALQPDNLQARAEIARAYLAMGEREAAKREFEAVKARQVPAPVRETIDRFLSAIAAAERTRVDYYFEFGAGRDSNINSATPDSLIAIPALGPFVLDPALTARYGNFFNLAGGMSFTRKVSLPWSIVGGVSLVRREVYTDSAFNTLTADGNVGMRWARGLEAVTVGLQAQSFVLDYDRYRESAGLVAQWQHSFDERRQATLYGQAAQLSYPRQEVRDADRGVIGVAYAHSFTGEYSPVFFGSLYGVEEKVKNDAFPNLGHQGGGLRLGGQMRFPGGWSAFASLSHEDRRYGGTEPLFFVPRKDNQSDLTLGVSYLLRAATTAIAQVSHTKNKSNIVLNDFERTAVNLSIRLNF